MKNFTRSLTVETGYKENAYTIKNIQKGINFYDTLNLIVAELNINIENVSDKSFENAVKKFKNSVNKILNDGYTTVSISFKRKKLSCFF